MAQWVHCAGMAIFVPAALQLPAIDGTRADVHTFAVGRFWGRFFRVNTVLRTFASLRISRAHAGKAPVRPDNAAVFAAGIELFSLSAQRRHAQYPCCKNLACLS